MRIAEAFSARMYSFITVLVLGILLFMQCNGKNIVLSDEKRLIKYLLENYERVGTVGRPVYNTSETLSVKFGLALLNIMDVNVEQQTLTTNVWLRYLWNDILLKWDPEDFGGIDHIRVPIERIWSPDIVPYNGAEPAIQMFPALAFVSYDGSVLYVPPFKLTTLCGLHPDPKYEKSCSIKFGSWTYDGFKLDIDFFDGLEEVDVNDYIESPRWALVGHPAKKNVKYYPCCEEPYPDLTFTLKIKLKTT